MSQTQNDTHTPAMRRDPQRLAREAYDLLVIGGGIYGVWAALDAAQRGLSVALLEQDDFGSGTSANSQRVVHGGLRYLQHGNLKRMRESIRERSTLLRVAGHMVEPRAFLVPTYGLGLRGRPAMFAAMKLNDAISADRNRGLSTERRIPNGRLISGAQCLEIAPGIEKSGLTGGAVFYDAQVNNSERLALAVVRSAVEAGAEVANHMRVVGLIQEGHRVTGVRAEDRLSGQTLEIKARLTLGCAGPWTGRTATTGASQPTPKTYDNLRAVVLVTRDLFAGMGLALPSRRAHQDKKELISKGFRNLFVTSWRGLSLIGTFYNDYDGDPDALSVSPDEVRGFIDEFNEAYPVAGLTYDDVRFTFVGLQPKAPGAGVSVGEPIADKNYRLIDHAKADGIEGLVTVLGVKWTTARGVAEQAVTLVSGKLDKGSAPCQTGVTRVHGAPQSDPSDPIAQAIKDRPGWAHERLIVDLFHMYGTKYRQVLDLADAEPELREPVSDNATTILAQVAYGVRQEMARTLSDVLFRRTPLGFDGWPGRRAMDRCAGLMAKELAWSEHETKLNVDAVTEAYRRRGLTVDSTPTTGR